MAKVKGLDKLSINIRNISIQVFKQKVKKFVQELTSYKSIFMKAQQAKLTNPNINDGNTNFPHYRTGNLFRNLVDVKMEKYSDKKFIQTKKVLKYTHTTTNVLDGGVEGYNNNAVYAVRPNWRGGKFYYARYLNEENTRYKGYFSRLHQVFTNQYSSVVKKLSLNL